MKVIIISLISILSNSCNSTFTKNSSSNSSSFELIKTWSSDTTVYRLIYTQETIEEAIDLYFIALNMESRKYKYDVIVLFYNDRNNIGRSKNLENKFNDSFIGGLERFQGKCFVLYLDENELLKRGAQIIDWVD